MPEFKQLTHALALGEYRRMDQSGQLTRPFTDPPMREVRSGLTWAPDTPTKGPDTRTGSLG